MNSSSSVAENESSELLCGTTDRYTKDELRQLPWVDNNQYLVDFLRQHNVPIPPDYLSQLLAEGNNTRLGKMGGAAGQQREQMQPRPPKVISVQIWMYHQDDGSGGIPRAQVEAPKLEPVLRVYPNPASGYLFIEPQLHPQAAEIELLNWQGRVVARRAWSGVGELRLPLAGMAAGLYLVRLSQPNGAKIASQTVQIN